jgi:hypothetical protein
MEPLDDYPIGTDRPDRSLSPHHRRNWRGWGVIAVILLVAGALVAFFVTRPSRGPEVTATDQSAREAAPGGPGTRGPLGPEVEPRDLPPLDQSDPVVRELLGALAARPELAAWLATDGLIRSFVASVDAIANGATPSPNLRSLAPDRPFTATARGNGLAIDPRSYQRFDGIADTAAALDADALARVYSTLRPRLQEAYRELGYPEGNFDSAVERAISRLLDTPLLEGDVGVQRAPVLFQFADPRIERLSAAQKQLLRMGPRNQRIIQDKLRDIARALGAAPQ